MDLVAYIRSDSGEILKKIRIDPIEIPDKGSDWVFQPFGKRYKVLDKVTDLTTGNPFVEVVVERVFTSHKSMRDIWIVRMALVLVVISFLFSIFNIGTPAAYSALLIALWASIVIGFYFLIRFKEGR